MTVTGTPPLDDLDRPVFVVGERQSANELAQLLGSTPHLCVVPAKRLLRDLVEAVSRSQRDPAPLLLPDRPEARPPATWYRDVQAEYARVTHKPRTVEFSGLAIGRLNGLFPGSQFIVVRNLDHHPARSRRVPSLPPDRLIEVSTSAIHEETTVARILAFLGIELEERVIDLVDRPAPAAAAADQPQRAHQPS